VKFSKTVLSLLFIFLFLFTVTCLVITGVTGTEPASLIMAVFGFCGVECGVLGWIKNTDTKNAKNNNEEDLLE
jgi:hypothetical protein